MSEPLPGAETPPSNEPATHQTGLTDQTAQAGVATLPAAAEPGSTPPPKPKKLVKWPLLVCLVGVFALLLFFLKDVVARQVAQRVGSTALGVDLSIESAEVSLGKGIVRLEGIVARDRYKAERELFSAKAATADLDLGALLRGRVVVDELRVEAPRGKVVRRKDGTIGIGEGTPGVGPGGPKAGEPGKPGEEGKPGTWQRKLEEMAKKRDFLEDMKKVAKRLQDYVETRRREEEERKKEASQRGPHPSGRALYVRQDHPAVVVRRLVCDDVDLTVRDDAAGTPPLQLVETRLELKNLSSDPFSYPDPIEVLAQGRLKQAASSLLRLTGGLDLAVARVRSSFNLTGTDLPVEILDPFIRDTLPLVFKQGTTADIALPMSFDDFEIDWRPLFKLAHIDVEPRDPSQRTIGGLDAAKLTQALREVGDLTIGDLRVFGQLTDPKVELGDTLEQLVVQGGKAFARRKAQEAAGKVEAGARDRLAKEAERLRARAAKSKAADAAARTAEGLLGGAAKAAGDGASGEAKKAITDGLGSLFGGKKDSEKKADGGR